MIISAAIQNTKDSHRVLVTTNSVQTTLEITPKVGCRGSSINGGELLFCL
jgi:hypothetical protein